MDRHVQKCMSLIHLNCGVILVAEGSFIICKKSTNKCGINNLDSWVELWRYRLAGSSSCVLDIFLDRKISKYTYASMDENLFQLETSENGCVLTGVHHLPCRVLDVKIIDPNSVLTLLANCDLYRVDKNVQLYSSDFKAAALCGKIVQDGQKYSAYCGSFMSKILTYWGTFELHKGAIYSIDYKLSGSRHLLISASDDRTVKIHSIDFSSHDLLYSKQFSTRIWKVIFHPIEDMAFIACENGAVFSLSWIESRCLQLNESCQENSNCRSLDICPCGKMISFGNDRGTVASVNPYNVSRLLPLSIQSLERSLVLISKNMCLLYDHSVKFNNSVIEVPSKICCICPIDNWFLLGGLDGKVYSCRDNLMHITELSRNSKITSILHSHNYVICSSADGNSLFKIENDSFMQIDFECNHKITSMLVVETQVETLLNIGFRSGHISVFKLPDLSNIMTAKLTLNESITAMINDSEYMYYGDRAGTLHVLDLRTKKFTTHARLFQGSISKLFYLEGRVYAVVLGHNSFRIYLHNYLLFEHSHNLCDPWTLDFDSGKISLQIVNKNRLLEYEIPRIPPMNTIHSYSLSREDLSSAVVISSQYVLSGSVNGAIKLQRFDQSKMAYFNDTVHSASIKCITGHQINEQTYIFIGDSDSNVSAWIFDCDVIRHLNTFEFNKSTSPRVMSIEARAFTDVMKISVCTSDGIHSLMIYDHLRNKFALQQSRQYVDPARCLTSTKWILLDSEWVDIAACTNGRIYWEKNVDGQPLCNSAILCLAYSMDSNLLVLGEDSGNLSFWKIAKNHLEFQSRIFIGYTSIVDVHFRQEDVICVSIDGCVSRITSEKYKQDQSSVSSIFSDVREAWGIFMRQNYVVVYGTGIDTVSL